MSVPAPRERFLGVCTPQRTVALEIEAVQRLHERLDDSFERACEIILACDGRVVVTGMGKSGHMGHKIAATLASTGTPAFYVHPAEASHGDIRIGSPVATWCWHCRTRAHTPEVLAIVPLIKRMGTT